MRAGLIAGGASLFAVSYFVPLSIAAATEFDNRSSYVAIPVVGPIMTAVAMDYGPDCDPFDDTCDRARQSALTLAGIGLGFTAFFQAGGLAMFGAGFAKTKKREVPYYAVLPVSLGQDGQGLGVVGTF